MTEIEEKGFFQNESWLGRNYPFVFLVVLIVNSLFNYWVNPLVFYGVAILCFANIGYFIDRNGKGGGRLFVFKSWLKTNLFALVVIAGLFLFTFIIGFGFAYLGSLVPEKISALFPVILIVGVFSYLIVAAVRFLEKSTKS